MLTTDPCHREFASRGAIGLIIVGVHLAVAALLMLRAFTPASHREMPAVLVDFLEESSKADPPLLPDPKLVTVAPVTVAVVVPDIPAPAESAITPNIAAMPAAAPAPAKPASPELGTNELPSLSEVAYLTPPAPHYPPQSRRAREEGLVVLRVLIDVSGHACNINIQRSSGHPLLDEAARSAVQHARFKPYLQGGIARAAMATIPIEFALRPGA
jgi:periplasmic protein TonB